MRFCIVTPCLNAARFIDETVMSVVSQAGSFAIRYHVQDGGSTDGTLDKLARWQSVLQGALPAPCEGVEFSYASGRDRGMYSAINLGFERCGDGDVMAWINADDRFEPGAFGLVTDIFRYFGDIDWLCGRTTIIDEKGAVSVFAPALPFPRAAIAAGLFDGRHWPRMIQQEGSFWRPGLWRAAGGLNADFRLAGDFDLWRRFARHADLVVVDAILGCFRRHSAQATTDMARYHAEIDRSVTQADADRRAKVARLYTNAVSTKAIRSAGLASRVVMRTDSGEWTCEATASADPYAPLTLRSLPKVIWAARRRLPPHLSIRRLLRAIGAASGAAPRSTSAPSPVQSGWGKRSTRPS